VVANYTVTDDEGATDTATLTITVTGANDVPVAMADVGTALEKSGLNNAIAGFDATANVLSNDTDVDAGDTKTVVTIQAGTGSGTASSVPASSTGETGYVAVAGQYGTLRIGADGSYRYLVDENNATVQALRTAANTVQDVFTYTMEDGQGATASSTLTITVEGANDAPTLVRVSNLSVTELTGATPNTTGVVNVGTLTTDDPDDGETFVYDIIGGAQQFYFQIGMVGTVATLQLREGVPLNAEFLSQYSVVVRSTDALGLSTFETFVLQIGDVNEFSVTAPTFNVEPMAVGLGPNTVPENTAVNTFIGVTAAAVDADATTNTITYSLVNAEGGDYTAGEFRIDAADGKVYVAGPIDREGAGGDSRTLFVKATSLDGSTAIRSLNLFIADVNEHAVSAPVDTNSAANTVAENAPFGLNVGITASATDADATTNTVTYSLVGDALGLSAYTAGEFVIGETNGVVTVGGMINRETGGATRTLYVKATSSDLSRAISTFTVNVSDVNEFPPVFSSGATGSVDENAATSAVVYQAVATDADATAVITYSLGGDDFKSLAIDSNGAVTLKESANFEGKDRYRFNVLANDGVNTATQAVLLSVKNVLELPAQGLGVTGDLWVGGVLALDLSAVSVADRAFLTFQWTANGASIAGATASSFTLSDAQVGMTMGVVVTGVGISGSVAVQMPGAGLVSAVDPASTLPAGTGDTGGTPVGSTVVVQAPESEDSGGGDGSGDSSSSGLVTLVSGMSQESGGPTAGGLITSVTTSANTEGVPSSVSTPLGTLSFTATSSAPEGEGGELLSVPDTFSLYVDKDQGINGFWVVDPNTGRLVNLASSVQGGQIVDMGDGKLRIDIKVTDGSKYDMETDADVVQVDGALGYVAPVLSSSQQVVPPTVFWF